MWLKCNSFLLILLLPALLFFAEEKSMVKPVDKDHLKGQAPKVFLDCYRCYSSYLRREIPYVNYVRDRKDADIHLMIQRQRTGAGGIRFTMKFFGQARFTGMIDRFVYNSNRDDSDDEVRQGLTKAIKAGLVRFIAKTSLARYLTVGVNLETDPVIQKDKWKNWVFRIGFNTSLSGEESYRRQYFRGSINASRVTPDIKINLNLFGNISKDRYKIDGETYFNDQDNINVLASVVKSINKNWSYGIRSSIRSSTFTNRKFSYRVAPAAEFNIFPYSLSLEKQWLFNYSIGFERIKYWEETIYEKMEEDLLNHLLEITYQQKTKWGSFYASLEASQYFHDLSKNRLEFFGSVHFRIIRGLSIHMNGRYSFLQDQLAIVKEEASSEEILLQQRQLSTSYDYRLSLGLSFSFGSPYNNVVNTRFRG